MRQQTALLRLYLMAGLLFCLLGPDFQTGKPSERRRRELARINRILVAVIEACERFLNRPEIRNAKIAGLQSGLAGLYPEPRYVP